MEILFISHKYPPVIGGMEKHAFELLTRLKEQHLIRPLIYDNKEGRTAFFFRLKNRVKAQLKANPTIDLIYVNEGLLASFAAQLKRITNIPIIATVHGLDVVFPNVFYQYFAINQLKKLDGIIAVSEATAQECIKRGITKDKVFVVNNGVDHDLATVPIDPKFLAKFEQKYEVSLKDKRVLVTMGRPVKRKGFSWLVEKVLPHLSSNTILLLIGPKKAQQNWFLKLLPSFIVRQLELAFGLSSDRIALRKGIDLPANKNRVIELGKLPFSEVLQLLKIANLFVMPNMKVVGDMEGFGLVALEAAISGTAVVAADIEGIRDAIQNDKNGFLLPAGKEIIWVEKIKYFLQNKARLTQFSQSAKVYTLTHFSWAKMAKEYAFIFEQSVRVIKK